MRIIQAILSILFPILAISPLASATEGFVYSGVTGTVIGSGVQSGYKLLTVFANGNNVHFVVKNLDMIFYSVGDRVSLGEPIGYRNPVSGPPSIELKRDGQELQFSEKPQSRGFFRQTQQNLSPIRSKNEAVQEIKVLCEQLEEYGQGKLLGLDGFNFRSDEEGWYLTVDCLFEK